MKKFISDFLFGIALGMGLAVAYVLLKLLAWLFAAASRGMPPIP